MILQDDRVVGALVSESDVDEKRIKQILSDYQTLIGTAPQVARPQATRGIGSGRTSLIGAWCARPRTPGRRLSWWSGWATRR